MAQAYATYFNDAGAEVVDVRCPNKVHNTDHGIRGHVVVGALGAATCSFGQQTDERGAVTKAGCPNVLEPVEPAESAKLQKARAAKREQEARTLTKRTSSKKAKAKKAKATKKAAKKTAKKQKTAKAADAGADAE